MLEASITIINMMTMSKDSTLACEEADSFGVAAEELLLE